MWKTPPKTSGARLTVVNAMPRLAANITLLFTEYPFLDRFAAAADHGFTGVEILVPYEFSTDDILGLRLQEGSRITCRKVCGKGRW